MIVFGTKHKTKKSGGGRFFCPQCGTDRKYTRYEVSKKGHVFFLSVMDKGTFAEYVQCRKCGGQFDSAVLATPSDSAVRKELAMLFRGCVAVMVSADGSISDEEVAVARRLNTEFSNSEMPEDMQRRDVAMASIDDLQTMLVHYAGLLPEEAKAGILEACIEVAMADGEFSKIEQHVLRRIGVPLGIPGPYLDSMINSASAA